MSPWRRRTTSPVFRSIDGMMVKLSNTCPSPDAAPLSQRALGREHALKPRLRRCRLIHRTRERLKGGLDNMMRIAAAQQVAMQGHPDLVGHRLHKVVNQ